jgi:excisionase family DNA binding protein
VHAGPAEVVAPSARVAKQPNQPIMIGAVDDRGPHGFADHFPVVLTKASDPRRDQHATQRRPCPPPACDWLDAAPRFPRRLIAEKRIRFVRLGRHVRIAESEIEEFVEAGTVQPITWTEVS